MPNVKFNSYLHLHFIVFVWGFTAILGALISLDALPLVWFRMVLALLFLGVYLIWRKDALQVAPKVLLGFLAAGLVIALHWVAFFKAIKVANISVTLACMSTGAFFASLIEPVLTRRRPVFYEILLGLVAVLGLGIIFGVETHYFEGILLALAAAFLSALFSVINSRFVQQHLPSVISFYEILGGVFFLSLYLLVEGDFDAEFLMLSASDWAYLAVLGSVCTAYAFVASVDVMKHLTPYTVMLTINLEPVYGIVLAVLIFKDSEKMSPAFYLGAVIILLTVLANGLLKSGKNKEIA